MRIVSINKARESVDLELSTLYTISQAEARTEGSNLPTIT